MSRMAGREGQVQPGVKLTYDDFVLFPNDGARHELIDGEHLVTPSPNSRHQRIAGVLHALIWNHLEAHPSGEVFLAPFDVVFTRFDVVEPDLLYMSSARRAAILTERNVQGVPELVVEIGSPSTHTRDETVKRLLYERVGCDEYWVVDPARDVVQVHRRTGQQFGHPLELRRQAGDVLTTPLLPGLTIPLSRLFRD